MAKFEIVRQLAELPRDKGEKRLLLALYSTDSGSRYIALSEQCQQEDQWISNKRGITIRRGELESIISALRSADFDAGPDNKKLSDHEYAQTLDWG